MQSEKKSQIAVLIVATTSSFIVPFMGASSTVALPAIAHEFSASGIMLSWIATAFLLASAMFLVPLSRAADLYGRRRIFSIGLAVFALSSVLCGLSTSIHILIAMRFFQGMGAAMIFGTGLSLLTITFPPEKRGRVMGINAAAVYSGLFAGPSLGGLLVGTAGWRSVFFSAAVLSVLVAVYSFLSIRENWPQGIRSKFDINGSVIYSVSLICLMYGCTILPKHLGLALAIIGCAGLAGFWFFERSQQYPVFDTSLLAGNKVFAFSNITALISYSATFAITFLMSLYLQYVKGFTTMHCGMILLCQPFMQVVLSPVSGRLSDRVDPRTLSSLGMLMCCAGLVSLAFLSPSSSTVSIVIRLIVMGIGFALFGPPNTNSVMGSVDKKDLGIASGILGTMRLLGQMTSMVIITILMAVNIGKARITPETYQAFLHSATVSYVIFSILCFIGIFTSLARGKTR